MKILIKELMKAKGVTNRWLREKTGISKMAIINIVNGNNAPSLENLVKIAAAMDVTLDDLVYQEESDIKSHYIQMLLSAKEYRLLCTLLEERIKILEDADTTNGGCSAVTSSTYGSKGNDNDKDLLKGILVQLTKHFSAD